MSTRSFNSMSDIASLLDGQWSGGYENSDYVVALQQLRARGVTTASDDANRLMDMGESIRGQNCDYAFDEAYAAIALLYDRGMTNKTATRNNVVELMGRLRPDCTIRR